MRMPTRRGRTSEDEAPATEEKAPASGGSAPTAADPLGGVNAKIAKRQPLSPVLLIRGDLRTGVATQIADGYHRVCASYYTDENTDIPVVIADLPGVDLPGSGR